MSILRKPLDAIELSDLEDLVAAEARETNELEFKGTLPFKPEKGQPQTADRWIEKGDKVGTYARDQILAELVAFANADGGTLILGLHETREHPRRAERLEPLPRCEDLARRLLDGTEDIIEPRLAMAEARAIPIDDTGAGYVVMRVGKSLMAPHRLTSTREFYIRRGERAAVMDIREIRDLTLNLARIGDRIDQAFKERRAEMHAKYKSLFTATAGNILPFAARATALPMVPVSIPTLTARQDLWWRGCGFTMQVGAQPYSCEYPARDFDDYPKIRLRSLQSAPSDTLKGVSRHVSADGMVEFCLAAERRTLGNGEGGPFARIYAGWMIGLVVGALAQIHHLRSKLALDGVEFGLEVEILAQRPTWLQWDNNSDSASRMEHNGSIVMPRYSVGPQPEFDTLIQTFLIDLSNVAGNRWDYPCEIPWDRLLPQ